MMGPSLGSSSNMNDYRNFVTCVVSLIMEKACPHPRAGGGNDEGEGHGAWMRAQPLGHQRNQVRRQQSQNQVGESGGHEASQQEEHHDMTSPGTPLPLLATSRELQLQLSNVGTQRITPTRNPLQNITNIIFNIPPKPLELHNHNTKLAQLTNPTCSLKGESPRVKAQVCETSYVPSLYFTDPVESLLKEYVISHPIEDIIVTSLEAQKTSSAGSSTCAQVQTPNIGIVPYICPSLSVKWKATFDGFEVQKV